MIRFELQTTDGSRQTDVVNKDLSTASSAHSTLEKNTRYDPERQAPAKRLCVVQVDSMRQLDVHEMDLRKFHGRCRCMQLGGLLVGEGRYAFPRLALTRLASLSASSCIGPDQLVVSTVPKSGTTWTLEMVWLLVNDCNFDGARSKLDMNRYEDVGSTLYFSPTAGLWRDFIPSVLGQPSTWWGLLKLAQLVIKPFFKREKLIKTHMPLSLFKQDLLETNKVIYVARNPKDALISYYHHFTTCRIIKYEGSLDDLAMDYMAGLLPGLPYFSHVLEAWRLRHHPNLLFLFYEDMKRDLPSTLRRVASFLGKSLTRQQIDRLCDHLSFDNMKNNQYTNSLAYQDAGLMYMPSFIRKGKVGNWRQQISEKVNEKLDEWIQKSLEGTGLEFQGM